MNEQAGEIREAYEALTEGTRSFAQIADIQAITGLPVAELHEALHELADADTIDIHPQALAHRITPEARRYAITRGGEQMHLITWN
jgi:hypothetical protein